MSNEIDATAERVRQCRKRGPDGVYPNATGGEYIEDCEDLASAYLDLHTPRPLAEWHEDYGSALWWRFPIEEPPYCGSPLWSDWPGYHTHWTPIPIPPPPGPANPAPSA